MYKLNIIKTPTNKYMFVGNIPMALCHKNEKRSLCGAEYVSNVYETREEAEKAVDNNDCIVS